MQKLTTVQKKQQLKKSKITAKKPEKDRKGGRLTKANWKYILKDADELIEDGVFAATSDLALSKRWQVSRKTIPDIRECVSMETDAIEPIIKKRFFKHFEEIEEDLIEMRQDLKNNKQCRKCDIIVQEDKCPLCGNPNLYKNYKEKLIIAREMPVLMEKFSDFLERYSIKEKIPDKVKIEATNINIDIDLRAESEAILKRIGKCT